MGKLFNNIALSFIWSVTQASPGGSQRLITIYKAHKVALSLKRFECGEASINEGNRSRNLELELICLIAGERDFLFSNPVTFILLQN